MLTPRGYIYIYICVCVCVCVYEMNLLCRVSSLLVSEPDVWLAEPFSFFDFFRPEPGRDRFKLNVNNFRTFLFSFLAENKMFILT